MSEVNLERLPLAGVVLDLGSAPDGRTRVTFRNLAAIYFLDEQSPDRAALEAALQRSKDTGEELRLTYRLEGKRLNGFQP